MNSSQINAAINLAEKSGSMDSAQMLIFTLSVACFLLISTLVFFYKKNEKQIKTKLSLVDERSLENVKKIVKMETLSEGMSKSMDKMSNSFSKVYDKMSSDKQETNLILGQIRESIGFLKGVMTKEKN